MFALKLQCSKAGVCMCVCVRLRASVSALGVPGLSCVCLIKRGKTDDKCETVKHLMCAYLPPHLFSWERFRVGGV